MRPQLRPLQTFEQRGHLRCTQADRALGHRRPAEAALAGPEAADPVDQRIEIALPGGLAVRVGRGFDAEALHRVLTVLGR